MPIIEGDEKEKLGRCGANVQYHEGFKIYYGHRNIFLGNDIVLVDGLLNAGDNGGTITIDDHVFFGHRVMVLARGHDYRGLNNDRQTSFVEGPIRIKEGAWIGSGAIVLRGATIGRHSVVGAGSVVTRDVGDFEVVAGNPARLIKKIQSDKEGLMRSPAEVEISSHRPVIGRFIVAYKKLIRALIAPYLRNVFELEHSQMERRLDQRSAQLDHQLDQRSAQIEHQMLNLFNDRIDRIEARTLPLEQQIAVVLNYAASFPDTFRELKLDNEGLNKRLSGLRADIDNVGRRLEFIRKEHLYELMHGQAAPGPQETEAKVLNRRKLDSMSVELRLNIGSGHIPIEGYLNIDKRELPDVDIVASAGSLPFDEGSVSEIFSSHLVEHFPEEEFKRVILPHWYGLIKKQGIFRAVLPDWEEMIGQYVKGGYPFEKLRQVTFGVQDYDGDFHFNMFSRDGLKKMLEGAGFRDVSFPVVGRINGDCYEMEVRAVK